MAKEEIKNQLEELANKKGFLWGFGVGDDSENRVLLDEWNKLVPEAEKQGITHKEMNTIFNSVKWSQFLRKG